MLELLTLKDIADLTLSGFALVGVYVLWKRLNEITDRLFIYLEEARLDRLDLRDQMNQVKRSTEVLSEKNKIST
jgi:hypothetical protein